MSPTIGKLEDTPHNIWGTLDYNDRTDLIKPTVFFGLYSFSDFIILWKHQGRRAILWAGSDITRFIKGYWLDKIGKIHLDHKILATWISQNCENWVENKLEYQELLSVGIKSKISPSFLGDISKFSVSWKPGNKVYTSVSGDDFELYDWHRIPELALQHPKIEFHLYGNKISWGCDLKNVIVHGRVSKKQMNKEIRHMQGALRLNRHDGFSEILAKSILMGQWPISLINYPYMLKLDKLDDVMKHQKPNRTGRNLYLKKINKFPWYAKST